MGLIKNGAAHIAAVSKDTGVTFKEQMCEGRGEASDTVHALAHVVAKQDSPNDHTDDDGEETVVRLVKKEASKKKSQLIASKGFSKSTSSSASKRVTVKHKPHDVFWHHIAPSRIMGNFTALKSLTDLSDASRTPSL